MKEWTNLPYECILPLCKHKTASLPVACSFMVQWNFWTQIYLSCDFLTCYPFKSRVRSATVSNVWIKSIVEKWRERGKVARDVVLWLCFAFCNTRMQRLIHSACAMSNISNRSWISFKNVCISVTLSKRTFHKDHISICYRLPPWDDK